MEDLPKIPSIFIEPYLQRMISMELMALENNFTEEQLKKSKDNLRGVEVFVSRFCGLHANIAVGKIFYYFYNLDLEQVKNILTNEDVN